MPHTILSGRGRHSWRARSLRTPKRLLSINASASARRFCGLCCRGFRVRLLDAFGPRLSGCDKARRRVGLPALVVEMVWPRSFILIRRD